MPILQGGVRGAGRWHMQGVLRGGERDRGGAEAGDRGPQIEGRLPPPQLPHGQPPPPLPRFLLLRRRPPPRRLRLHRPPLLRLPWERCRRRRRRRHPRRPGPSGRAGAFSWEIKASDFAA